MIGQEKTQPRIIQTEDHVPRFESPASPPLFESPRSLAFRPPVTSDPFQFPSGHQNTAFHPKITDMRIIRNVHGKTVTQNGINPRFAAHLMIRRKKTALSRPHSEKHAERNTVCVGERIPGAMRHVPFSVMAALLVDVLLIAMIDPHGGEWMPVIIWALIAVPVYVIPPELLDRYTDLMEHRAGMMLGLIPALIWYTGGWLLWG